MLKNVAHSLNIDTVLHKFFVTKRLPKCALASTEGFEPSQNSIQRPRVYSSFLSFIYGFMLYFSYKIDPFFAFFSCKVYRDISKYIGILDLVRVGQYLQKPLC